MTPRRRRVLERYIAIGNPKACGVNYSLLRRYIREACAEFDCPETMLALHLSHPKRKPRHDGMTVQLMDLSET
jgi:hypothetical protein